MVLTASLTAIVFLLSICHLFIRHRRIGRLASNVPGPFPYPFIGNMLSFNISSPTELWKTLRYVSNTWYPLTRVWMCTEALYSVRHPEDLEILLTSRKALNKGWSYDYLHPWLKQGLLTSKEEKWYERRKILTPTFHFNVLKKYMEIIQEQGESIIKYLRSEAKDVPLSLMPFASNYTLNIICETAMGVALDKLKQEQKAEYTEAIYTVGNIAVWRMPKPYLQDWMLNLTPFLKMNRDHKRALSTLHGFTSEVVKERREYHARTDYKYLTDITNEVEENDGIYMARKKRMAMLDLLLSAEKDGLIDDEGIKEEVDTFSFEGHDTTAMAITYSLLFLAEYKEVQNKARAEVIEVLSKSGGKLGMKEIKELNYVECCLKEALRLYPPVATIFRHVKEDLQLKHALVPAGSTVIIHFFDLHRDPNYWPDPEKYDPDRFLFENCQNRHPFAYLPFSAGFRNCIGQKFALMELKSLIANILYNFYLEPVERLRDIELIADIVIRPSIPVHVKFIEIENKL